MKKSTEIIIIRDDEEIKVTVDLISFYKGSNEPDDPMEIEMQDYGYDSNGLIYTLSITEYQKAQEEWFKYKDETD